MQKASRQFKKYVLPEADENGYSKLAVGRNYSIVMSPKGKSFRLVDNKSDKVLESSRSFKEIRSEFRDYEGYGIHVISPKGEKVGKVNIVLCMRCGSPHHYDKCAFSKKTVPDIKLRDCRSFIDSIRHKRKYGGGMIANEFLSKFILEKLKGKLKDNDYIRLRKFLKYKAIYDVIYYLVDKKGLAWKNKHVSNLVRKYCFSLKYSLERM